MTARQTHLSHPKYRPDIDGLRAIAVLAVVIFHAFPKTIKGGFIGVDIFFVISGYLISTIIFENLDKGTFSFFEFYARRIKRIFPALILVLASCFIFGWLTLFPDELQQLGKHIASGAGFVSNFVFWNEAGYFDKSADTKPLLHLWSLGIEEQFYIFWPLILWLAWKQKFNLLVITIFFAIASFILNLIGIKQDAVATFYSPQTRFWELLSGSLLAWLTLYKKDSFAYIKEKIESVLSRIFYKKKQEFDPKILANVISFIGLFLLLYGFWRINKDLNFPGKWALVPVIGTSMLIIAGSKTWVNRSILSNKFVIWFGLISFPLYLWHWPLLSFARIINDKFPSYLLRTIVILASVLFAWLTYKFVECPIRFGKQGKAKVAILCVGVFIIGVFGYIINKTDFSKSHTYENLVIKRRGFEFASGYSLAWYRGKEDWLFLGNSYDNTVAKLKLAIVPSESEIEDTTEIFSKIAETGAKYNTKVALILGPNKSSIYPEYLPDKFVPSSKKYVSFFLDKLNNISNLNVYNPTNDFLRLKKTEGILYYMTDTHWNNKGAFLAYLGFSNLFALPVPQVKFQQDLTHSGDLIEISKLNNFPLHPEDNWDVIWKNKPVLTIKEISNEQKTSFDSPYISTNQNSLSDKYIWVVGDSFTSSLKQYFNATFKEVSFIGHWDKKLKGLPEELTKADRKPDMIIVVRVERSF